MPDKAALQNDRHVLIFFLDGVGLGGEDENINPFVLADTPNLDRLLGRPDWYLAGNGAVSGDRGTLMPTDATLGVAGRPQSATGQAAILTGRNVPSLIGEHYGPKPNQAVGEIIRQGTLFSEVKHAGGQAALLTPYPDTYFEAVARGKRLYSAVPLAVTTAGWPLYSYEELRQGQAVSPGFTNQGWRDYLGYDGLELITHEEAGQRIGAIAQDFHFSFFEHWPSDRSGHRGSLEEAAAQIMAIDNVLGGLLAGWDDARGLLIITSDHGNIEEKDHRLHTLNHVPTILVGNGHQVLAQELHDLTDIARIVRRFLGIVDGAKIDEYWF